MHTKKTARLRRAKSLRCRVKVQGVARLSVFKTPKHFYAQIIDTSGKVLASSSTTAKNLKSSLQDVKGKVEKAKKVGEDIVSKAKAANLSGIVFDRSGYPYHGRVKAIAEVVRAGGIIN